MMDTDTFLVQARWQPAGGRARRERGAEYPTVSIHAPDAPPVSVVLHRVPVGSTPPLGRRSWAVFDDEHLVAGPGEAASAWLSTADVILRRETGPGSAAWSLQSVYARFPGCLVAAIIDGEGCVVGTATGWQARLMPLEDSGTHGAEDMACVCASVVHAWLVAHRPLAALQAAHLRAWCPTG